MPIQTPICDFGQKAVAENTKHYQENWKKYSKSIFRVKICRRSNNLKIN